MMLDRSLTVLSRRTLVASLLIGAACDPAFIMHVDVRSAADGAPVPGARVRIECPEMPPFETVGKPDGTVDYSIVPGLSGECLVTVGKEGMQPAVFKLEDRCNRHFGLSCTGVRTSVRLDSSAE